MQTTDIRKLLKDPSLFKEEAYIDGQWVTATDKSVFTVNNPATSEVIAQVTNLGASDAEKAITAANKAFPKWRDKTAKERANLMRKWFDLILQNKDD